MDAETTILSLPVDILLEICSYLSYASLCSLVLVCRAWREVGEDPWLWSRFPFIADIRNCNFLNMKRFEALESLKIYCGGHSTEIVEFFKTIRQKTNIKAVEIQGLNIVSVDQGDNLADGFNKLESLTLRNTFLGKELLTGLFRKTLEKTKLKKIRIYNQNLKEIEPNVLAQSLNKLEDVELFDTELTNLQVNEIFGVMNKETNIHRIHLFIGKNSSASADCRVFTQRMNNLHECVLSSGNRCWIYIMQEQNNHILAHCKFQTRIVDLVDPTVLAMCVKKLQKVDLCDAKRTRQQVVEVFKDMDKETKLQELDILQNDTSDVNQVPTVLSVDGLELADGYMDYAEESLRFGLQSGGAASRPAIKISVTKLTKEQVEKLVTDCPVKTDKCVFYKGYKYGKNANYT